MDRVRMGDEHVIEIAGPETRGEEDLDGDGGGEACDTTHISCPPRD
jgi:hypothetical protein